MRGGVAFRVCAEWGGACGAAARSAVQPKSQKFAVNSNAKRHRWRRQFKLSDPQRTGAKLNSAELNAWGLHGRKKKEYKRKVLSPVPEN